MTVTELNDIAASAMIGLKQQLQRCRMLDDGTWFASQHQR